MMKLAAFKSPYRVQSVAKNKQTKPPPIHNLSRVRQKDLRYYRHYYIHCSSSGLLSR